MHYLALTFKHAVEFSSFGCTPRICLGDSCLGQLDLLYSSLSPESNPVSDLFLLPSRNAIAFAILSFGNLTYFIQILSRSQIRLSISAAFLGRFTFVVPASRQPALPYQDLDPSQVTRSRAPGPRPRLAALVPVVVLQSAQDQGLLGCGGCPLGPAAARSLLLAASRTPQGSENITRAVCGSQLGLL